MCASRMEGDGIEVMGMHSLIHSCIMHPFRRASRRPRRRRAAAGYRRPPNQHALLCTTQHMHCTDLLDLLGLLLQLLQRRGRVHAHGVAQRVEPARHMRLRRVVAWVDVDVNWLIEPVGPFEIDLLAWGHTTAARAPASSAAAHQVEARRFRAAPSCLGGDAGAERGNKPHAVGAARTPPRGFVGSSK